MLGNWKVWEIGEMSGKNSIRIKMSRRNKALRIKIILASLQSEIAIIDRLKISEKLDNSVRGIGKMSGNLKIGVLWHPCYSKFYDFFPPEEPCIFLKEPRYRT